MAKPAKILLVLFLLLSAPLGAAERMNILFIAIDDLRPELGCYGGPQVKTPHMDKLASEGIRFDRAYCQIAVCGASRANLMTGILPTAKRFRTYTSRADQDTPWAATLPETLKKAGYTTLSNGKIFHYKADTEKRSWSEPAWRATSAKHGAQDPDTHKQLSARKRGRIYEAADVEDSAYPDGKVAQKTIEDLRRLKKAGKPFFLGCGFVKPHMPFYAPKRYWDLYKREEVQLAGNRFRPKGAPKDLRGSGEFRSYHLADFKPGTERFDRMMRHGYLACVSYIDKLVGDVLAELDRLELADNTIVVVWGDHGWHLGEHTFWGKHNTMHLATRVPLLIKVPGKKGGATQALVETGDIFPTLCALTGVEIPKTVQGRSFAAILDQPAQPFRKAVYSRFGPGDAIITDQFSYTRYKSGAEMLYDLKNDPDENENVVNNPKHKEIRKAMQDELKKREAEAASAGGEKEAKKTEKDGAPGYEGEVPVPSHSGVAYGKHERHILDFWQAESDKPTPLVFVIHGGGWVGGSKERLFRFAEPLPLLKAGISVAAINYRLMKHAQDVVPPVKAPLHDAARALQFVRSKAKEWNVDPERIAAAGGSAGGCSSLWLAYHDDMADPDSEDPVARQSTRLLAAAVRGPQTTLDPQQMKEWMPNSRYGAHAFGKKDFAQILAERETILPWITEYSPYALASAGDPPVHLFYGPAPEMGKEQKDPTHSANFGIGLQQKCKELGIGCEVYWSEKADAKYKTPTECLIDLLTE